MLVGSIRRILHDANVHRLGNCYSNRLSCVVIDQARRPFEQDIVRALVDIEFAKRLQRVVAAAPPPPRKTRTPAPKHPKPPLGGLVKSLSPVKETVSPVCCAPHPFLFPAP